MKDHGVGPEMNEMESQQVAAETLALVRACHDLNGEVAVSLMAEMDDRHLVSFATLVATLIPLAYPRIPIPEVVAGMMRENAADVIAMYKSLEGLAALPEAPEPPTPGVY